MSPHPRHHHHLLLLLLLLLFRHSAGDVGTAASYGPPYIPTKCFGNDRSPFPANAAFAAAGPGIWDNGAACGRRYLVRCLSSSEPAACLSGDPVQITVVDEAAGLGSRPSMPGTTMALSQAAFTEIASFSASQINIEFTLL